MLDKIKEKLNTLIDYTVNKSLKETQGLEEVEILDNNILRVRIVLGRKNDALKDKIKNDLVRMVKIDLKFKGIKYQFDYLTITDKKVIFVTSGKGGVGKSTISALLALFLNDKGFKVGLLDSDIYGPSLSSILNIKDPVMKGDKDEKIYPYNYNNIEFISIDLFVKDPLMLRGPMLGKMLDMFFEDVLWSKEIEYLIVDLPPGTGDVPLDLNKYVPDAEILLVTTPQIDAAKVAVKAGLGAIKLGHKIIGVVENMSYYYNVSSKERDYIFGKGGSSVVVEELKSKLLAQIPLISNANIEILKSNDIIKSEFEHIIYEILKEEVEL